MKFRVYLSFCLALGGVLSAPAPAILAQEPVEEPASAATGLLLVDDANLANLPSLLGRARGVSLRVDRAALEAAPAARDALLDWVESGGVVFLHTDAAQEFGYVTVPARQGNPRQGGQLYGRARAALPWASHPLLWGDATPNLRDAATRLPGVNTIFYQARVGDHLVVSHPEGTPILRVADLTAPQSRDLFAVALAPFGRGLTVFTPDFVDQRRGDGAAFVRNLLGLLPDARGTQNWVFVSQNSVTAGGAALITDLERALTQAAPDAPALPAFGTEAPTQPAPPAQQIPAPQIPAPTTEGVANAAPVLLLTREQASAALAALRTTNRDAVLSVLRAHVALLRGEFDAARSFVEAATQLAPNAREVQVLQAILTTSALFGGEVLQPQIRAQFALGAVENLNRAATAPALLASTGTNTGAAEIGLSPARLRAWANSYARRARLLSFEPPMVRVAGNAASAVTVRFYPGDATSVPVAEAATRLTSSLAFGWYPDELEILLFPSEQTYLAYRAAAGLTRQNVPTAVGAIGDVAGNRILLSSVPPVSGAIRTPNGGVRVIPRQTDSITGLARLYAYSLLVSWFDGGGQVPGWLALGLEEAVIASISGAAIERDADLERFAQAGGLLAPAQFNTTNPNSNVARAQAASIVAFFFQNYGVGAFAETVQRLGAGEDVNVALDATTGETEESLFLAWRNARFGPRQFPNRG